MVLDRGHRPEASNEIANCIQRGVLGIEITADDQPDLADVGCV
jgi:hypothetical protein